MEWINTKDALPDFNGNVLVVYETYRNGFLNSKNVKIMEYSDKTFSDLICDNFGYKATHWLKIPEIPND